MYKKTQVDSQNQTKINWKTVFTSADYDSAYAEKQRLLSEGERHVKIRLKGTVRPCFVLKVGTPIAVDEEIATC